MLELHIGNVLTHIVGDIPPHVKIQVREQSSYSIKGAEFSTYGASTYCPYCKKQTEQLTWEERKSCPQDGQPYRRCAAHGIVRPVSLWDGKKFLVDARATAFPTGIISRIIDVLRKNNIPYKIIDERIVPYTRRLTWHGPELRYYQKEAVQTLIKKTRGIVHASTGVGKCLREDQTVLCFNGLVKKVSEIVPGDKVMGIDSKPRTVKEVHTGVDQLYRVEYKNAGTYYVTKDHILTLKVTNMSNRANRIVRDCRGNTYSSGDIVDISVEDFLESSPYFKHVVKGFYGKVHEFGRLQEQLPVDPYFLGIWLGDGNKSGPSITTMEPEVIEYMKTLETADVRCSIRTQKRTTGDVSKAKWVGLVRTTNSGTNTYLHCLQELGVINNKHIPTKYLYASYSDRCRLLAGILDSDGYTYHGTFEIVQKNKALAEQIVFLVRSLGLYTTMAEKYAKCQTGNGGIYYRIHIGGNFSDIPFKVPRRIPQKRIKYNTDQRLFGVSVVPDKVGRYYGFSVEEEDKHFLLGDFAVAHNSNILAAMTAEVGVNTLILAHSKSVFHQLYNTMQKCLKIPVGMIGDGIEDPKKITVAMPQSLVGTIKVPKKKKVNGVWKTVNTNVTVIKEKYRDFLVNTEALYVDECFPGNTRIQTEDGPMEIRDIVRNKYKGNVWSFNMRTRYFEYQKVTNWMEKKAPEYLYKITIADKGSFTCTGNHPIYVYKKRKVQKIRADYVCTGDLVIFKHDDSGTGRKKNIEAHFNQDHKVPNVKNVDFELYPITKINVVRCPDEFVYNITVQNNHNYVLDNDCLVSNCHRVACDTVQLVANSCVNAFFRIGVSATPYRADLLDILIEAATGKVNYRYTATQAIADGYLSKPNIHLVRFKQSPYPKKKLATVVDKKTGVISEKMVPVKYADLYEDRVSNNSQRNLVIANIAYKHFVKNESVLIIVRHLEHGENLYKLLNYLGRTVKWVNGENDADELKKVLKDLNSGECRICIASGIFNEGIDVTGLNVCINTTACDSPVTAMQILGRTLRRTTTKSVVDFYDIHDYGVRWLGEHAVNRREMYGTEPAFNIFYEESDQYL